jgi:hypothetical protein
MNGTLRYWRAQYDRIKERQEFFVRRSNDFLNARDFEINRLYLRRAHIEAVKMRRLVGYYNSMKKGG